MSGVHVSTTINGDPVDFVCAADEPLLDVLRNRLGLTGAKEGCGTGDCGACSITIDGRLVCSCLVLGAEAQGRKIETIEGMAMATSCIRCSRNSSSMPPFNAASARQASCRGAGAAQEESRPIRRRNPFWPCRQSLPLHRL